MACRCTVQRNPSRTAIRAVASAASAQNSMSAQHYSVHHYAAADHPSVPLAITAPEPIILSNHRMPRRLVLRSEGDLARESPTMHLEKFRRRKSSQLPRIAACNSSSGAKSTLRVIASVITKPDMLPPTVRTLFKLP